MSESHKTTPNKQGQIAVIGGGLAGKVCSLALASKGLAVSLFAPEASLQHSPDGRSTALLEPSLNFFEQLGLIEALDGKGADLKTMRILDAGDQLVRSRPLEFNATEYDAPRFGTNFLNHDIHLVLDKAIESTPLITPISRSVDAVEQCDDRVQMLDSQKQTHSVDFAVLADGKHSKLREMIGIEVSSHEYPQTAIVLNLVHTRPHLNASTEFHTKSGPLTFVPMPNHDAQHMSSLVWVVSPEEAKSLQKSSKQELARRIEERSSHILGEIRIVTEIQCFSLSRQMAHKFATGRVFLIGETAHALPPIGAQGFNLTLRDVKLLADLLTNDKAEEAETLSEKYHDLRSRDAREVVKAVDIINKSIISQFLAVHIARVTATNAMNAVPKLKRIAVKLGLRPSS